MADTPLTAERILATAEEVLRRYGPAKATVVDVARALGVSHGSVYRHYPSKSALRAAVTRHWLDQAHTGLAELAAQPTPAPQRLARWLTRLLEAKRRKALEDPELFATYTVLAAEQDEVIAEHVSDLLGQIERIISDGVTDGAFTIADPAAAARAVFDATARFHDPLYAASWADPATPASLAQVSALLLAGLGAR